MILISVGIIASAALAFWIVKSWAMRASVFGALCVGVACYAFVGAPSYADNPLHKRLDEMRNQDPQTISPDQWIALLQERAKETPDDPQPHKYIGDMLMAKGKPEEAVRAYQSALRRDARFVSALTPLADALVAVEGRKVTEQAQKIYIAAFAADTSDVKAAFMPGMRYWLEGDRDAAREWWAKAQSMMPEGSKAAAELSGQVEMLQTAMANVGRGEDAEQADVPNEDK
ncbi:tetratricopeptide repeat protein [Hirschia litorea]|uniref:Tetratricopeptide repeat protein n=1 Tax=Hirschia litorea TaxID=1199156 RepID=A0ABW2IIY3_9PROT